MARAVALAVAVALVLLADGARAFGTRIDPGARECYVESVEAGGSLAFTFRVTDGGSFDIDVTMHSLTARPLDMYEETTRAHYSERVQWMLKNTTSALVNEWRRASEGSHSYTAPSASESKHGLPAEVTVCFDNAFSAVSPKWVLFQFLKRDVVEVDPQSLSRAEAAIEGRMHRHGTVLFDLAATSERLRQTSEADRARAESLARIITVELVGNIVILGAMAVYQYTTLTRFLTRRRGK